MKLTINGEQREFPDEITVAQLIERIGVKGPYAVELNRTICPKARHGDTTLKDQDQLEIVTIVGGG